MKKLSILAALAAAFLSTGVAQTINVTGAGATFPYPMYSKWFNEYHKAFPNIQINYQSIGSGGGIKQVTEGTVDFGASDGPTSRSLQPSAEPIFCISRPCSARTFSPITSPE
jgi:phosphate transport system substrate-binding protein